MYVCPHTDRCVFSYYWICTGTLLDDRFSACVLAALFPETLSDCRCVRDRETERQRQRQRQRERTKERDKVVGKWWLCFFFIYARGRAENHSISQ
jgi:hypothetical protein